MDYQKPLDALNNMKGKDVCVELKSNVTISGKLVAFDLSTNITIDLGDKLEFIQGSNVNYIFPKE